MTSKRTAISSRRPAPRRVLPSAKRRHASGTPSQGAGDALLAHWTAMQQAMAATGALRR